jgi:hypothetical protein
LALGVVLLAVTSVSAQSGGLKVIVVDAGGPLPGATVTISHDTGYVKANSELTNARGVVEFPVLRPGKGYNLEISFPGFGTRRMSDLRVQINKVQDLTVQLAEEVQEHVKVVAEGDVVDLEKTSTSTKFSDEFIQDLPVPGRFYQNVLTLAPGVQDADGDGNPNVHGSRDRDFKAVVSGISNVDPLTGQWAGNVNPNSIEEMEVITAGASVEFSRAQGGFARILQKQGSNEFEGVFEYYYRSSALDGDGAGDFSNLPDQEFDWHQPSFQVSGPIIKDKLWYRLSHERIDQELPVNVVSGLAVTTVQQTINSDQITWQVSPRNKLAFQYQSDPLEVDNFGVSSLTPPEASQYRERNAETFALTWTAPYSPKILVESQIAWQDITTGIFPSSSGIKNNCVEGFQFLEDAQCFNLDTNEISGSYFRSVDDHRQRFTFRSDATVFGGRFWGASHQFKFGMIVENERYFRHLERKPNMNIFIFDAAQDSEDPGSEGPQRVAVVLTRVAVPETSDIRATGVTWGLYAEDQIKPVQNLTITVGARLDREEIDSNGHTPFLPEDEYREYIRLSEEGFNPQLAARRAFRSYEALNDFVVQLAQTLGVDADIAEQQLAPIAVQSAFWETSRREGNINTVNNNLSPFLSVAWDPWSNGKTKFAATARRYYDKLFLNIPLIELEPVTTDLAFNADPTPDGFVITGLRTDINPAVNISTVDRELTTPYQDEFTFSFERELWAETSIKVTYINRKFRDQLQDTDINHVPADLGRCKTASLQDPRTLAPVREGDPAYDPALAPGDGIVDDCAGEVFIPEGQDLDTDLLARENRLERPDGIPDLYVQNPAWGDIFLVGNLNSIDYEAMVLELVRRQYRSWELQASYTFSKAKGDGEDFNQALGDDRSLLDDEAGFQSYDQRHVVKVNATTITPWGFRLGGAVTWQSGLPYSLLIQKLAFDSIPPQYQTLGAGNPARVRQQYETGQRNDQRNDSYWNFDLKFTKEMNLGRGLNMQISLELFNMLNDGTYLVYDPLFDSGRQINGTNIAVRRFGRQWQVGFKLAF